MTFDEIIELYNKGDLDAKQYSLRMFEKYEELLEYKNLIKKSHVNEIKITQEGVVFSINNKDNCGREYSIDMALYPEDVAAVPVTVLNFEAGYEPEELLMVSNLCSYISKEGVFLDIGANLGWYSLNMCKQYPNIQSYAFEPINSTYIKMNKNLVMNSILNCKAFNFGFSDENKNITFFYEVGASGASSMVNLREVSTTKQVTCEVRRLDDFVREEGLKRVDFIKCDVEGAELLVYKGGLESIKKFMPIIFSEILRKWSAKFNYHPNDIINLLKEVGYECFVLGKYGKLKKFGYVTEDTIETNYFFLHSLKHNDIIKEMCI